MKKIVLGTAQLGLDYGINNQKGKPSVQEAVNILDCAFQNGIRYLDTASVYGNSEEIIGRYIKCKGNVFKICTKLPAIAEETDVLNSFEESRNRLFADSIYIYYLHKFEQCKQAAILRRLVLLQKEGFIENIGISIYEPEELRYIVENLSSVVDVVQIPFNMLNSARWLQQGNLIKAKEKGIKIYVRSVFLQGLLLVNPDSGLCREKKLTEQLRKLDTVAKSLGYSIAQLAINYIFSVGGIERCLFGCETIGQLQQNVILCKSIEKLPEEVSAEIQKISSTTEIWSVDPRKWG